MRLCHCSELNELGIVISFTTHTVIHSEPYNIKKYINIKIQSENGTYKSRQDSGVGKKQVKLHFISLSE